MYIVQVFVVRLLVDPNPESARRELQGSVVKVATQETHLFENGAGLLEILRGQAQEPAPDFEAKPDHQGEAE